MLNFVQESQGQKFLMGPRLGSENFDKEKFSVLLAFTKEFFRVAMASGAFSKDRKLTDSIEFGVFVRDLESCVGSLGLDMAVELLDAYFELFQKIKRENPENYKLIYENSAPEVENVSTLSRFLN